MQTLLEPIVFTRNAEPELRQHVRERARLTRREIADSIGVSEVTIWRWERGRGTPTGPKGQAYCRLLHELLLTTGRT